MHSPDRILPGAAHPRAERASTSIATNIIQKLRQPSRLRGRLICAVFALLFYTCALATRGHQAALRRYVAASVNNAYFTIPYSETLRWKDDDEITTENGTDVITSLVAESWEQIMTDPGKPATEQALEENTLRADVVRESGLVEGAKEQFHFAQATGTPGLQLLEDSRDTVEQKQVDALEKTQDEKTTNNEFVEDEKEFENDRIIGEEGTGSRQEKLFELAQETREEPNFHGSKIPSETMALEHNIKSKTHTITSSGVAHKLHGSNNIDPMNKWHGATASAESNRFKDGTKATENEKLAEEDRSNSDKASIGAEPIQGDVITFELKFEGIDHHGKKISTAGEETEISIEQDTVATEPDPRADEQKGWR